MSFSSKVAPSNFPVLEPEVTYSPSSVRVVCFPSQEVIPVEEYQKTSNHMTELEYSTVYNSAQHRQLLPDDDSTTVTVLDNAIENNNKTLVARTSDSSSGYSSRWFLIGLLSAVTSYVIMGVNPVITRYLITVQKIPPMSINGFANILVLCICSTYYTIRILLRYVRSILYRYRSIDPEDHSSEQPMTADEHQHSERTLIQEEQKSEKQISKYRFVIVLSFIIHTSRYILKQAFMTYGILWFVALFALARSAVNIVSTKYTKATYIQLVSLCAPFIVSIISISVRRIFQWQQNSRMTALFLNEKINWKMTVTMSFTMMGGGLIILSSAKVSSGTGAANFWHFPPTSSITSEFTKQDILGIGLALVATILISAYNISLKIASNSATQNNSVQETSEDVESANDEELESRVKPEESNQIVMTPVVHKETSEQSVAISDKKILITDETGASDSVTKTADKSPQELLSSEQLLFFHLIVFAFGYLVLSAAMREKLSVWSSLSLKTHALFITYALSNYLLGNIVYIAAIKFFGATNTSSVMAISLVSTIGSSWIMLGETIHNIYQVLGIIIVLCSITAYMFLKRRMMASMNK